MSQNTVCVTSLDLIIESSPKTTYSPVIQLFLYGNNEFTSLAYTDTTEFFSIQKSSTKGSWKKLRIQVIGNEINK